MLKEQLTKHEAITKAKKLIGETIIQQVNEKHQPMNLSETFIKLQQALPRSKKAIEYLESRGIHDAKLEIGYNNGTSFNSLKNCIVFPLKDHQDNIVSLYGRSITNDKEQRHFYLKDRKGLYPHYPVYNFSFQNVFDTQFIYYLKSENEINQVSISNKLSHAHLSLGLRYYLKNI